MEDQTPFFDDNQHQSGVSEYDAPDLSEEDYAEHTANQTASALQATQLFEIIEVRAGIGQAHMLGRVKQDNEKEFLLKIVDPVLKAVETSSDCDAHICKQFIRKNGKTKYAWTISFASKDIRAAAHLICESFVSAIPKREVTESPLVGPSTPSGGGPLGGRKGAAPVRG